MSPDTPVPAPSAGGEGAQTMTAEDAAILRGRANWLSSVSGNERALTYDEEYEMGRLLRILATYAELERLRGENTTLREAIGVRNTREIALTVELERLRAATPPDAPPAVRTVYVCTRCEREVTDRDELIGHTCKQRRPAPPAPDVPEVTQEDVENLKFAAGKLALDGSIRRAKVSALMDSLSRALAAVEYVASLKGEG